jgi:hypothetical protein
MTYENFGNIIRNMWQNILDNIKEQRRITNWNSGNIIRNVLLRKYWDKIQEQMWMTHGKCMNIIRNCVAKHI